LFVTNTDDDVFMFYYAPWCGHCKKLHPVFEELATELKDVPHLVIASFDATNNDVEGITVTGFPTLAFYSKENKKEPTIYKGDRSKTDLLNFLKNQSTHYKNYLGGKEHVRDEL